VAEEGTRMSEHEVTLEEPKVRELDATVEALCSCGEFAVIHTRTLMQPGVSIFLGCGAKIPGWDEFGDADGVPEMIEEGRRASAQLRAEIEAKNRR
jgi:hypothetical protein